MASENLSKLVYPEISVEFHKQQNLFAQDLHFQIKTTVEEVVKSIQKLDIHNEQGKQAILSQCNSFVENLGSIIYQLQDFMRNLQENIIGIEDLIKLIEKFVEILYLVQHSLNQNSEEQKLKLIKSIQDVIVGAADLLKIIENQKIFENKKKLIRELCNLLRIIDCISTYNKFLDPILYSIKQNFDGLAKRIQAAVDIIKNDENKIVLYHLIDAISVGCQHMQNVVQYLKTYADQYDTKTHNNVHDKSTEVHYLVSGLQDLFYKSDVEIKPLKDLIRKNVTRGCLLFGTLEDILNHSKDYDSRNGIVHVACSDTWANTNQLVRGLENVARLMEIN